MSNDEAKQRAKNYMSLKGALEPNQIKCDCGPQEERKQTAVDWLTEKLRIEFGFAFSNNILEQAKSMEKQQIIDACIYGPFEDLAEDFYNKTYS
jgi:hypothetical protein